MKIKNNFQLKKAVEILCEKVGITEKDLIPVFDEPKEIEKKEAKPKKETVKKSK